MKIETMFDYPAPNIKPFIGIAADATRKIHGKDYRVIVYCAYDAGIIGPEMNGIAVLCEDPRTVVADGIEKQQTGYFGASEKQLTRHAEMIAMSDHDFIALVEGAERFRGTTFRELSSYGRPATSIGKRRARKPRG